MSFSVSSGSLISLYSRRCVPATGASRTLYAHRLALAVAVRVHSAARQRLIVRVPGDRTISPRASFSSVSRLGISRSIIPPRRGTAWARGAWGGNRGRRTGGGGGGAGGVGGGEKRPEVSRCGCGLGETMSLRRRLRLPHSFPWRVNTTKTKTPGRGGRGRRHPEQGRITGSKRQLSKQRTRGLRDMVTRSPSHHYDRTSTPQASARTMLNLCVPARFLAEARQSYRNFLTSL